MNMPAIALAAITVVAIACGAPRAGAPPTGAEATDAVLSPGSRGAGAIRLSAAAAQEDIALARLTLESMHPGYARYVAKPQLASMWTALESKVATGIARSVLYLELARIVAAIRCSHTRVQLAEDLVVERDTMPLYLPFRFVLFGGRMYIERTAVGVALERGDEVVSIDDVPVETWLREISPLIPVDGDAEQVRAVRIASSSELMGSGFDLFAPFVRPVNGRVKIVVRSATSPARTVLADRLAFPAYQAIDGVGQFSANFADSVRFKRLGKSAAYLAVDTFINYRNQVDPLEKFEPIFSALREEKRRQLILDLRNNGGGSTDAQVALLRYLIREPVQQTEAVLTRFDTIDSEIRPHIDTWIKAALSPDPRWFEATGDGFFKIVVPEAGAPGGPHQPTSNAFRGDLTVLIGANNSSGSTHLLAVLRGANRATFIGARTGGAPTGATAGILYTLTLPNSRHRILVPAQRIVIANAEALPVRNGIEADIRVLASPADYFGRRDVVLEAALQRLENR